MSARRADDCEKQLAKTQEEAQQATAALKLQTEAAAEDRSSAVRTSEHQVCALDDLSDLASSAYSHWTASAQSAAAWKERALTAEARVERLEQHPDVSTKGGGGSGGMISSKSFHRPHYLPEAQSTATTPPAALHSTSTQAAHPVAAPSGKSTRSSLLPPPQTRGPS